MLICAILPTYYEPGRWLPTITRHQDGLSWNRGQSCRDTLRLSVCYLISTSKSPSKANIVLSSTEDLMSVKQLFEVSSLSVLSGNDGIKDCVDSDRVQKSWWTKRLHQEQRKYLPMYRILSTSPVSVALEQPLGGSATQTRCWWSCGQFPFTRTGECVKVKIGLNISLCIMFTAIYVTSNYHRVHPNRFIPSKISTELNHCFKVFQL